MPGNGAPHIAVCYRSACLGNCVSEKVRDQVIQGAGPRLNTTVLYNGVDPQCFSGGW